MKKKLIFRADGNSNTGLGHLYRLFAIVEMIKDDYDFVYVTQSSSTIKVIPNEYPIKLIDFDLAILDEPQWISSQFCPDEYIVIADGYHFTSDYQKALKEQGFTLIYIDDLGTYHMYADVVVNHSSSAKKISFNAEDYTKFALGMEYALLRPKFLEIAKLRGSIKPIDKAFICFGGADKFNFSYKTVEVLLDIPNIKQVHVVLGAAYKNDKMLELKKVFQNRLRIYINLSESDLLKVMLSCNFAITPTSTILYELSCVKMPIVSGYFVDNQVSVYNWFKEQNCFFGIGDFTIFNFEDLKTILKKLNNNSVKKEQINNQAKCIDGNQKERFLKLIATFANNKKCL